MSEIEDAFARVRGDSQHRDLPDAAHLRRRSDRRARRRATVGTLALVALGVAVAGGLLPMLRQGAPEHVASPPATATAPPQSSPSAPPSPSLSPPAPPTAGCPGGAYAEQIPARALVVSTGDFEDQALAFRCGRTPTGDAARALPQPCAVPSHPSDRSILGRRGILGYLKPDQEGYVPDTYYHTVTKYTAPEAAAAYLAELRQAVESCGGRTVGSARHDYTVVDRSDGSLVLDLKVSLAQPVEGSPQRAVFRIVVVRIGAYVSVLRDVGWEGSPTSPARFDGVAHQARTKLGAL